MSFKNPLSIQLYFLWYHHGTLLLSQNSLELRVFILRGKECCLSFCSISPLKLKPEGEWLILPRGDEGREREGVGVGERLEGCW